MSRILRTALPGLLLAAAALRGADVPYENGEFGFAMSLPSEWSVKEGVFGAAVAAVDPAGGAGFRDNLTVSVEDLPPLMKVDDYLEMQRKRLAEISAVREVEVGDVRCGDLPGRRAVYSLREGPVECRTVLYLVPAGRKLFVLAGTAATRGGGAPPGADPIARFDAHFRSFRVGAAGRAGRAVKRIRDRAKGFSIEFPGDWEVRENLKGTTLIAFSPVDGEKDAFRENVNVLVEALEAPVGIDAYAKAQVEELARTVEGFAEPTVEEIRVGDIAARRLRYTQKLAERELTAMAYLLVKDRRGYIVTAAGDAPAFATHEPAFKRICESLRLE